LNAETATAAGGSAVRMALRAEFFREKQNVNDNNTNRWDEPA
jgi:hypothetical protein